MDNSQEITTFVACCVSACICDHNSVRLGSSPARNLEGENNATFLVESLAAQQEQIAIGTKQMLSIAVQVIASAPRIPKQLVVFILLNVGNGSRIDLGRSLIPVGSRSVRCI